MNLANELKEKFSEQNLYIPEGQERFLYDSAEKANRFYYYNEIKNSKGNKKATVIMINPSEAKEDKLTENDNPDNTIENLYKIIQKKLKCVSEFEVLNLYSKKTPEPEYVINDDIDKLNSFIIKYVIEKTDIIIPAWGVETKFNDQAKALIAEIKDMCKHKDVRVVVNQFPCHFSTQCTSIDRNPEFIQYTF